jgi:hypothetical protein
MRGGRGGRRERERGRRGRKEEEEEEEKKRRRRRKEEEEEKKKKEGGGGEAQGRGAGRGKWSRDARKGMGLDFQFFHLLAVRPWAIHLTSLSFSFLM